MVNKKEQVITKQEKAVGGLIIGGVLLPTGAFLVGETLGMDHTGLKLINEIFLPLVILGVGIFLIIMALINIKRFFG